MKTVFINCSPKKRFCASAYFLALQRLFVGGEKVTEKLRTPADHARILEQLRDADSVVFCLPLYVDGISPFSSCHPWSISSNGATSTSLKSTRCCLSSICRCWGRA